MYYYRKPRWEEGGSLEGPLAALVAAVVDSKRVNLTVSNKDGSISPACNVLVIDENEECQEDHWCQWPTVRTPVQEAAERGFHSR
jgi:hypothetical protein